MEFKVQKIIQILTQIGCIQYFQQAHLEEIAQVTTEKQLKQTTQSYGIENSVFLKMKDILLSKQNSKDQIQDKVHSEVQNEALNLTNTGNNQVDNEKQSNEQSQKQSQQCIGEQNKEYFKQQSKEQTIQNEISSIIKIQDDPKQCIQRNTILYHDLYNSYNQLQKIDGSFSYKHHTNLELKVFINNHSHIKQNQQLVFPEIDQQQEIYNLQQCLSKQGHWNSFIKQALNKLKNPIKQYDITHALKMIEQEIKIINIDKLVRQIKRLREIKNQVKNKKGIIFLGCNQIEKLDTIRQILGYKLDEKNQSSFNIKNKQIKEQFDNFQQKFNLKVFTNNILAAELPETSLNKQKQTFLINTPDFNNIDQSFFDISNCIGINQMINSLFQVSFVVVINGKTNEHRRNENQIKQTIYTLNKLFPKYKQISNSIVLLFNNHQQQCISNLTSLMNQLWNSLSLIDKNNTNLQNIFNDFQNKINQKKNMIQFNTLNADEDHCKKVIKQILKTQSIKSNFYGYFALNYCYSTESKIQKQFKILENICFHYFEQNEMKICQHFLSQLHLFSDILGGKNTIYDSIKTIEQKIENNLNQIYFEKIKIFNQSISNNIQIKNTIQQYFLDINQTNKYDCLKQYIKIPKIKTLLISNIEEKISTLIKNIKQQIYETTQQNLSLLVLLLKTFNKQKQFNQIITFFQQKKIQQLEKYQNFIKNGDYNASPTSYCQYNFLIQLECLIVTQSSQTFDIDNVIVEQLQNQINSIIKYFDSFQNCTEQQFIKICEVSTLIKSLKSSQQFLETICNEDIIIEKIQEFDILINEKANSYLNKIFKYLEGKQQLQQMNIKKMVKFFHKNKFLQKIPHLTQLIIEMFSVFKIKIKVCLDNGQTLVIKTFEQINNQTNGLQKLKQSINVLNLTLLNIQRIEGFSQTSEDKIILQDALVKMRYYLNNVLWQIQDIYKANNIVSQNNTEYMIRFQKVINILIAFQGDKQRIKCSLFKSEQIILKIKKIKYTVQRIFSKNVQFANQILQKIQKEYKEISDDQITKYEDIKLHQINFCFQFIQLCYIKSLLILRKQKQWQNIYKFMTIEIINYFDHHVKTITQIFQSLSIVVDQNSIFLLNLLCKKRNCLQQINSNYPFIKSIIKQKLVLFLQWQLQQLINITYTNQQIILLPYEKMSTPNQSFRQFIFKQRIFYQTYNKQKQQILVQNNKQETKIQQNTDGLNIQSKFKFAIQTENYQQIVQYLKIMEQAQNRNYQWAEKQTIHILRKLIKKMKQHKIGNQFESLQDIIEDYNSIFGIKQQFESLKIQKKENMIKTIKQINSVIDKFSSNLIQTNNQLINKINYQLLVNHIETAYISIIKLQKFNSLTSKCLFVKMNESQANEFNNIIANKIQDFQTKYLNVQNLVLTNFLNDYNSYFSPEIITHDLLLKLKTNIQNKVKILISGKINTISQRIFLNKKKKSQIDQFINYIPQDIKKHTSEYQQLIKITNNKFQTWQNKIKQIESKASQQQIFDQTGKIKYQIQEYINDENISEELRKTLLTKIQTKLMQSIKIKQQNGFQSFVYQFTDSKQLRELKNNQSTLKQIVVIRQKIFNSINIRLLELLNKQIESLVNFVYDESQIYPIGETQDNLISGYVNCMYVLFQYFSQEQCFQKSVNVIKSKTQEILKQFIEKHQHFKKDLNNLSKIIKLDIDRKQLKVEIGKLFVVKKIQQFINMAITTLQQKQQHTQIISHLFTKFEQSKQNFVIKKYQQIFEKNVLSKKQQLIKFSLKNERVLNMNQIQIENQFKENNRLFNYLHDLIPMIKPSLRIQQTQDMLQQLSVFKGKINKQAQSFQNEIFQFTQKFDSNDNLLKDIKQKITIVQKYSQYYPSLQNTSIQFQKSLSEYHKQLYFQGLNVLQKLQQLQTNKQQKQNTLLETVEKQIQQINYKYCQQQNQAYWQNIILENHKQKKQQQIKQLRNSIENNKIKVQQQIEKTFKQGAKILQVMHKIPMYLSLKLQDYKQRNTQFVFYINKKGDKKWLKKWYDLLSEMNSQTAKIIISSQDFKEVYQNQKIQQDINKPHIIIRNMFYPSIQKIINLANEIDQNEKQQS